MKNAEWVIKPSQRFSSSQASRSGNGNSAFHFSAQGAPAPFLFLRTFFAGLLRILWTPYFSVSQLSGDKRYLTTM
jgi:hypothetical protein